MRVTRLVAFSVIASFFIWSCKQESASSRQGRANILFLGHASKHHESSKPAEMLGREIFNSGVNLIYTENINDLNDSTLSLYDGLVVYANYDTIAKDQADALLKFVKQGKGFVPIHCASWCFRNNDEVVKLIGGQFKSHEWDSFPSHIVKPQHPALKNQQDFTTLDETYVHDKLADDIVVLTERIGKDGKHEPYTWVKEYGDGRVFYTAYGHDEHTWTNEGFLNLVKNGVLWSLGGDVQERLANLHLPDLQYSDAKIPNYEKRDPPPQLQAPLTPAQSMLMTQLPPGFELKLFAAEPDIKKPIYMNWDHRGRLWVIETVDYPNTVTDSKMQGDDRIKILEDTDGDGKADKVTLFADKLNLPTSFAFSNNGIIVSQAPYFLYLQDTNGDDKADKRDTIITGWGTFDTHAGPSNLRYGLNNKYWGVVGYSGFRGVGDNNDSLKFSQGAYSFNPDGKNLTYLGRTSNNTWGLGFTEENDVFISTANNTHSAFLGIPQKYLQMVPGIKSSGIEKIDGHYDMHVMTKHLRQVDVHGGFTAAAGHNLYTARNFPKEYWNRIAFVCEPTGRVIHKAVLQQKGSSFIEKDGWNLLASSDEWIGPVQAEVGPDGEVWMLDFYNFIIQHNPTPEGFENGKGNAYINPLRDTTKGRIYRIVYTGAKAQQPLTLDKNKPAGLVDALKNENMFWRTTAQRLLVERKNQDVVPDLLRIVSDHRPDAIGLNGPVIHALWTLQGLGALNGSNREAMDAVSAALKNANAGVRKAAIEVLPATQDAAAALIQSGVFKDADLRVRLAAALKTADLPVNPALLAPLVEMAKDKQNTNDKWVAQALYIAMYKQNKGSADMFASVPGLGSVNQSAALGDPNQVVIIKPIVNAMKFDTEKFTVRAGSVVEIVFQNVDFMQHNLLVLQQGSMDKVGAAADQLAQDPKGVDINYIPQIPEVLFATPLVNPEDQYKLLIKVPEAKGDYPFICSFPGHWRIMNGVMEVQ